MGRSTTTILIVGTLGLASGCYSGLDGGDANGGGGDAGTGGAEGSGGSDGGAGEAGGVPGCEGGGLGPRSLRLLTRREYRNTVADLLGVEPPDVDVVPIDPVVDGYDNDAEAAVVTSRHVDAYMAVAEQMAEEAVALDGPTLIGCMPADPECDRSFVVEFGRRAFRRPLTDDEVEHYLSQFTAVEGDFYEGAELAIRAMLVSPHFLYRSELGEEVADGVYRMTSYEVASALSYTLWGTMPDAELLAAAQAGELDDAAGIESQARRLLDHPRGAEQVVAFATQWLGTGPLLSANKDAAIYPAFTDEVRESMAAELDRFVEHVIFDGDQTVEELLTADYVFINDVLADFYGLPRPGSSELVRVELDGGTERGGLLHLGAILASHAHPNESSPVKRGVFVRDRLMCQPLPPPPPDIEITPPELDPNATTRERFDQHTSDPACAGCHQLIDGVGFGFENYDGVGGFRLEENGLPVDASGTLIGLPERDGAVDFDGVDELSGVLASSPSVGHCAVRQFYRFTHGRPETPQDECVVEELSERFDEAGGNLHEMFILMVSAENFTLRRG